MNTHTITKLALLSGILTFSSCSSGGGGGEAIQASSSDVGTSDTKLTQSLFSATNSHRSSSGKSSLAQSDLLAGRALEHAKDLAQGHGKSGKSEDAVHHKGFSKFSSGARSQGYIGTAENVAWTFTPASSGVATKLLNMFNQSPSHRKNMMASKWTDMGVAVVKRGNYYYAVQIFGTK